MLVGATCRGEWAIGLITRIPPCDRPLSRYGKVPPIIATGCTGVPSIIATARKGPSHYRHGPCDYRLV